MSDTAPSPGKSRAVGQAAEGAAEGAANGARRGGAPVPGDAPRAPDMRGEAAAARAARPAAGPAGARSADEIDALHAFRLAQATAWFAAAAAAAEPATCPICCYRGPFSPVRHKIGTWCPSCDSRPRHRLMWLWLTRHAALKPGLRVLHFAAEATVGALMARQGCRYRTADLAPGSDLTLDIEAMARDDGSEDLIIANHVLEHVDDARALTECRRVLAPGGRLVVTVPIIEGWDETLEDPAARDPATRQRLYGDPDHRRFYGRDLRERILAAGFALEEFGATEPDVSTHALNRGERLFIGLRA